MSNAQLKYFTYRCVVDYATYQKSDKQYDLDFSDLPDEIKFKFAKLFISQDDAYASEAIGPDNPLWKTKMLPALSKCLENSGQTETEFVDIWKKSVVSYFSESIQELIDNELQEYNNSLDLSVTQDKDYGA